MLAMGKVGIAPGTTTIAIRDELGLGRVATQDPGVRVRNAYGQLAGLGVAPTDFDLAKIYGYQPVHHGWVSGRLVPGAPQRGIEVTPLSGCSSCVRLGQDEVVQTPFVSRPDGQQITPEQQAAILALTKQQLDVVRAEEEIKHLRSARFWGGVAALAAATTAIVGILAFTSRK